MEFTLVLIISSLFIAKANGRSWHYNLPNDHFDTDHAIFFDDYGNKRWHGNTGDDFEEWKRIVDNDESNYKHLRSINSDRVWFPDFSDSNSRPSTTPRQVVTTTTSSIVEDCIRDCPTTSEYNPVCGTNGITYSNMGRLECAQFCGVGVNVHRRLPCSLVSQEPTNPTSEDTPTVAELQRQCQESCPTTPEYNPICGTNNITYQNRGRLECAKICGVDVEVKRLSPCPRPLTTLSPFSNDVIKPTDQVSWTTTTSNNVFTQTTETPERPIVTIPQEILNNIFNIPTTDSNEVDIDIRQKN